MYVGAGRRRRRVVGQIATALKAYQKENQEAADEHHCGQEGRANEEGDWDEASSEEGNSEKDGGKAEG